MNSNKLAQALLQSMTVDMQAYILPGSKVTDREFANQMIGHLDGPQQREVDAALEAVQTAEPVALGQPDKLEQIIDEYVAEYEQMGEDDHGRDCYHLPDERERDLIKDAIVGLLAYPEWDDAWGDHLRTLAPQQAAAPDGYFVKLGAVPEIDRLRESNAELVEILRHTAAWLTRGGDGDLIAQNLRANVARFAS